jgi:hypothetical protein
MMTNRNTEEVLLVDADVCSVFGSEKRSCTLWTPLARGKLEQYICVCDTYSDASWKNDEKSERNPDEPNRKPNENLGKVFNLRRAHRQRPSTDPILCRYLR